MGVTHADSGLVVPRNESAVDDGPEVHGQGAALPASEHVEAHVRGDAVQPRPHRRPTLEAVDAPPRADHRLLHGVVGLEHRAEHPVAVAGELPAMDLEGLRFEIGGGRGFGMGRAAIGREPMGALRRERSGFGADRRHRCRHAGQTTAEPRTHRSPRTRRGTTIATPRIL